MLRASLSCGLLVSLCSLPTIAQRQPAQKTEQEAIQKDQKAIQELSSQFQSLTRDLEAVRPGYEALKRGDYEKARKELFPLAAKGNVTAILYVMDMYDNRLGVPYNPERAAAWCRLGAENGVAFLQERLAQRYSQGKGVPKDLVQGMKWARLSMRPDTKIGESVRDDLRKVMTPTQIAEAERLAEGWSPKRWADLQKEMPDFPGAKSSTAPSRN